MNELRKKVFKLLADNQEIWVNAIKEAKKPENQGKINWPQIQFNYSKIVEEANSAFSDFETRARKKKGWF